MAARAAPAPEAAADAIAAFRPESATPDDVEHLIDYRVGQIDDQIKTHLSAVDDLREERKRWIGVTGGRSRIGERDDGVPA
jgi:hypothetical protein